MASNIDTRTAEVIIKGSQASASMKEIEAAAKLLRAQLNKLPTDTQEFVDKSKQLRDINARLKDIKEDVNGVKESFVDMAKGFLLAGGIEGVFEKIKDFAKESIDNFAKTELSIHQLQFALTNIGHEGGNAFKELNEQAEQLQGLFSRTDILATQRMLVQFGLTSKQVEKLTPQIIDLAEAQGTDLATATTVALRAIEGQTKGLKTAGIAFSDTGSKTENFNQLTQQLSKFQGEAASAMKTASGEIQAQGVEVEKLSVSLGERLAPAWLFMKRIAIESIVGILDSFSELFNSEKRAISIMESMGGITEDQAKLLNGLGISASGSGKEFRALSKEVLNTNSQLENQVKWITRAEATKADQAKTIIGLTSLQKQLNLTTEAGKAQYVLYTRAINQVNEAMQKTKDTTDKTKISEKDLTKLTIDELNSRLDAVKKHQGEFNDLTIAGENKEVSRIDAEIKRRESANKKAQSEKERSLKALQDLDQKYADATLKDNDKTAREKIEADAIIATRELDEKVAAAKKAGVSLQEIAKLQADALLQIKTKYTDDTKALDDKEAKDDWEAAVKEQDKEAALAEENGKKELERITKQNKLKEKAAKEFGKQMLSLIDSINTIEANHNEQAQNDNDENLQQAQAKDKALLDKKLITQAEFNKREDKAQKAHDAQAKALKKEQFERDQKIAIFKAIIAGAEGIAQIWGTYGDNPILAAALSITEGIVVGAEIKAIKSAPKPYAQGDIVNTPTYGVFGEDGPEALIPLSSNKRARGKQLWEESGRQMGLLNNWMTENPSSVNISQQLDNVMQSRSQSSSATQTTSPVFSNSSNSHQNNQDLAIQIRRLNDHLDNGIGLNYDKWKRSIGKIDNAKQAARVG